MTPFRSYVAVMGAALASIFARQLHLNQGIRTYIAVSLPCSLLLAAACPMHLLASLS